MRLRQPKDPCLKHHRINKGWNACRAIHESQTMFARYMKLCCSDNGVALFKSSITYFCNYRCTLQVWAKHLAADIHALHSGMWHVKVVKINSPCSPIVQNTGPSSCIYVYAPASDIYG